MSFVASSTTPRKQKYDVFISFRGIDTRNNFLSHLHDALCRAKIKTFIDDDLNRGDDVPEALLRTIKESKISVVIFSENYASSSWCLDELAKIMECNEKNAQIVIPIFLKVPPTYVRHQTHSFAQALDEHRDHPKIQRWRDVLTKAANLSGWDSQVIRCEATFIKAIVSDILGKLYNTSSRTCDGLVGMSSRLEQIDQILKTIPKEVRIIGFWGMGGIGKSTLARAFFNLVFPQFEGCYMIQNFKETCEKCGLNELLDKLVSGLLKDKNSNVGTPNLEISFIRDRLRHMNVLIVLDDVNDFSNIELLVGRRDCLGRGSIVVITSRNKQVLRNGVDEIYEVLGLDDHEALCLFAQHAFKLEYPRDDHWMALARRVIYYANGNPLALKVLGSYLLGRSNEEQESALRKLERTPNMDIQKVLRISYEVLDNEEKNIFLNIACFFNGSTIDVVKRFHDGCRYSTDIGIRDLVDKSLITFHTIKMWVYSEPRLYRSKIHIDNERVWMHDLLRETGREIVREECIEEPGKRSRLWDYDDISHVLRKNTGTKAIKGISVDLFGRRRFYINPAAFERMPNLEFLEIYNDYFFDSLPQGLGFLPNKLIYLCWKRYPLTYLPSNFHGKNLIQLTLCASKLVCLWNGRQELPNLREINLSYSKNLIEIPDLSMAPQLRILDFYYCPKIKNFPKVSTKIEYLYLGMTAIKEVPSSIDRLTSLIQLRLGGYERLKNLPDSIDKLKSLQHLNISLQREKEWEHLEEVDKLKSLQYLDISLQREKEWEHLEKVDKLKSLQYLDLSLQREKEWEHLEEVNIHPRELTNNLGCLSALKHLNISGTDILKIPVSIKQLTNLKYLNLYNCKRLKSLPQLPMNVQEIYASNCVSLERMASPFITVTMGEFDSVFEQTIEFYFEGCVKLNQNALNSIATYAELKSLQWKVSGILNKKAEIDRAESFSMETGMAEINFRGGDIPDWFKCKSLGSSLTVKLPEYWCNSELICFALGVVVERKNFVKRPTEAYLRYFWQINNNLGNCSTGKGGFNTPAWVKSKDFIQSSQVLLKYEQSFMTNTWRMMPKETDDAAVISIQFHLSSDTGNYEIKKCGIHLLYRHETEDRCRTSRIDSDFPSGSTQLFFNPSSMEEDMEETGIGDAKVDGGFDDNCCNTDNLVEFSPPMRRKKRRKCAGT